MRWDLEKTNAKCFVEWTQAVHPRQQSSSAEANKFGILGKTKRGPTERKIPYHFKLARKVLFHSY